jgi:SPOR domain
MKKCPMCSKIYADDVRFCYADGATLDNFPERPVEIVRYVNTPDDLDASTFIEKQSATAASAKPYVWYIAAGSFAILAAGALIWLAAVLYPRQEQVDRVVAKSGEQNETGGGQTGFQQIDANRPGNEKRVHNAEPVSSTVLGNQIEPGTSNRTYVVRPSKGTWFIVLGSFPNVESEKADQRLRNVQGQGYSAAIIDTDRYPGLRAGFLSVVVGPYTQSEAKTQLAKVKTVIPDAYVKSGW